MEIAAGRSSPENESYYTRPLEGVKDGETLENHFASGTMCVMSENDTGLHHHDSGKRAEPGCRRRRALIGAAALVCLLVAGGCTYRWIAARSLAKEVSNAARDPATGILLGAEPLSLGAGKRGVLLLHGFIGSPKDFGILPQRLAEAGYFVYAPLLPGHGTKPQDLLREDADTWFAAARASYRELRARCAWVAVVGFSMGGTLAARLAVEEAAPPDALVLAAPFLGVTYRWYAILPPATWNRILMPVLPYVIKGTTFVQVNRREAIAEIVSYRTVPTHAIHCLSQAAARVRKSATGPPADRTLLIYATGDGAASPRRTRKTADRWGLPPSSRLVLTRANHHIFWDYEREEVVDAIVAFLDGTQE